MSLDTKRRLVLASLVIFALIVFCVLYVCHRAPQANPVHPSQVEALNDALKNGLITKSQYDAELKKLKESKPPQSEP